MFYTNIFGVLIFTRILFSLVQLDLLMHLNYYVRAFLDHSYKVSSIPKSHINAFNGISW